MRKQMKTKLQAYNCTFIVSSLFYVLRYLMFAHLLESCFFLLFEKFQTFL